MKTIITLFLCLSITINLSAQRTFTLSSNSIGGQATQQEVFNGMGCTGKNQSPQLSWCNAPKGTKSFAINMFDPDAPTGSGFCHWVVFDIPANITQLDADAGNILLNLMPDGAIQSETSYGTRGYGGPCPPEGHGIHQYTITIYALNVDKLGLDGDTNPSLVGFNIWANTLAKASIVFYYERGKVEDK